MSTTDWARTVLYTPYPRATGRLDAVLVDLRQPAQDFVVCSSVDGAAEALSRHQGHGSAVLIDAVTGMSEQGLKSIVLGLKARMPFLAVVVIGKKAGPRLVRAALRAEALDFIDIAIDESFELRACPDPECMHNKISVAQLDPLSTVATCTVNGFCYSASQSTTAATQAFFATRRESYLDLATQCM